jgi:hypothetical protein
MANLYLVKPTIEGDGEFVLANSMLEAIQVWCNYEKEKPDNDINNNINIEEPESVMLVQDYIIGEL